MSFWYDIKNKKYASNGSNSWLRAYVDKVIAMLKAETDGKLSAHYAGTVGRHKANEIDCSDGSSVEQSLQKEAAARLSGDSEIHHQLQMMEKSLEEIDTIAGRKNKNGGEIFGDSATNQAISNFATASGTENLAGMKAFKVKSKSGIEGKDGIYELDSVVGLEVGDIYSVRFDWDFLNRGEILAIDSINKKVCASNFVSRALDENNGNDPWENTFFVLTKPDVGTVDRGLAAHVTGIQNKNYGTGSFVTGLKNIATGLGAFIAGKKNKAGCCATVGGCNNNASGTFSAVFGAESEAANDCDVALGSGVKATGGYSLAANKNTKASGRASSAFGTDTEAVAPNAVAFGQNTKASQANAVALGSQTEAGGYEGFACGFRTKAAQNQAFAQGRGTIAGAFFSHAEGNGCSVWGAGGHAEGKDTMVHGVHEYAHVEGIGTQSTGNASHAEGKYNAGGDFAHVVGNGEEGKPSNAYTLDWQGNATFAGDVKVQGDKKVATAESVEALPVRKTEGETEEIEPGVQVVAEEGATIIGNVKKREYSGVWPTSNTATGKYSVALGENAVATGRAGIAMGTSQSKADLAIAGGEYCTAEGIASIAMGVRAKAMGSGAVALGYECVSSGVGGIALGKEAQADGSASIAMGYRTETKRYQISAGHYNLCGEEGNNDGIEGSAFTIGNGSSEDRSNAFHVLYDGTCYAAKTFEANSADIAETYEWIDGNPDGEDRRGLFVTLDGTKIRLATPNDDYIKGVVSARPCLVGDAYNEMWHRKYLTDIFGAPLTQTVHHEAEYEDREEVDEETGESRIKRVLVREEHDSEELVINPDYDSSLEYIPRSKRPEFDFVSSWGKLVLVDDGSCEVNGFATVGEGGKATKAETQTMYRVMERKDENHIYVAIG